MSQKIPPFVDPGPLPPSVTPYSPTVNFLYLSGTVLAFIMFGFFLLGIMADWLTSRLSTEREVKLGQWFMQSIETQVIEDDPRSAYLQDLLEILPLSGETIRLPLKISLLEDETINAAAFLGGHVLINTGLLKAVESENELAFVLAHEIGHFKARDPLKTFGRSLVYLVAYQVMGLNSVPQPLLSVNHLSTLSYSRRQERKADEYALERIYRRYGHVGHALDLFKRLAELEPKQGSRMQAISQYFDTHPASWKRQVYLNELAQKNGWPTEGKPTPLPALLF